MIVYCPVKFPIMSACLGISIEAGRSVLPTLLHSFPYSLDVFAFVVLEEIGSFDISGRGCVRIV